MAWLSRCYNIIWIAHFSTIFNTHTHTTRLFKQKIFGSVAKSTDSRTALSRSINGNGDARLSHLPSKNLHLLSKIYFSSNHRQTKLTTTRSTAWMSRNIEENLWTFYRWNFAMILHRCHFIYPNWPICESHNNNKDKIKMIQLNWHTR